MAIGVLKKFGEDRAGALAALVAYYSFFSLFPLLLVMVTVVGFLTSGDDSLRRQLVDSTLARFPVIGDQLQLQSLSGTGVALAVGIVTALWAGLGAMQAMETAMNEVWDVPRREQPNFVVSRLRALAMLGVFGVAVLGTVVIGAAGTYSARIAPAGVVVAAVLSLALATAVFLAAFRVLPNRRLAWRDLVPGAVVAGVGFVVLQFVGGYYVTRTVRGASEAYGVFAVVIGLLSWLHLQAQLALLAAEVNVVRAEGLWPRSLTGELTDADVRTLERHAKTEERHEDEEVQVDLRQGDGSVNRGAGDGAGDRAGAAPRGRSARR